MVEKPPVIEKSVVNNTDKDVAQQGATGIEDLEIGAGRIEVDDKAIIN